TKSNNIKAIDGIVIAITSLLAHELLFSRLLQDGFLAAATGANPTSSVLLINLHRKKLETHMKKLILSAACLGLAATAM
ncbi:MAG: hypothetical protein KC488_13365, partial [Candidatus Cloacimonetes bacterium]|nr:hypothetical protein [Candidatus Cloacimonadota bacterium]